MSGAGNSETAGGTAGRAALIGGLRLDRGKGPVRHRRTSVSCGVRMPSSNNIMKPSVRFGRGGTQFVTSNPARLHKQAEFFLQFPYHRRIRRHVTSEVGRTRRSTASSWPNPTYPKRSSAGRGPGNSADRLSAPAATTCPASASSQPE
jgi:hypothetical protein